jgi:hypothetical protein
MRQRLFKHSGTVPKRLRRASAIVVIALLCAGGAFSATPASGATWIGTVHGTRMASNDLVAGGFSWQGSFRLTVNKRGAVDGHAVVGYLPLQDLTVLNGAITYVRDVSTDVVNTLVPPPFNLPANAGLVRQIVGASVRFRESMAVRRGHISGRLNDGRLTLKWGAARSGIRYDIFLKTVTGSQRLGSNVSNLPNPFTLEGGKPLVGHIVARGRALSVYPPPESESGPRVDSYWVADRIR